ncbi:MAG TPA: hypothetical protein VHO69_10330 [Phototrophicaceae bacterium]|nr:hypothetical protein [Phototrophicaceae bacterium]
MNRILSLFKRIGADIVAGRNLESYVVTVIGIALIFLDIVGDVDDGLKLTVVIAALMVLVFKSTTPETQTLDLDHVLHDRDDFGPFRETVRGRRQVWIYGPSSVNALREDIEREVLDKGGTVRIMLQDPDSPALDFLCDQLDTRDPRANLKRDLETSIKLLEHISASVPNGKLECRLLPYSPGYSMVLVEPDGRDGQITLEFLGFRYEHIKQRMHIVISRLESPRWFDHWKDQYQRMWDAAKTL